MARKKRIWYPGATYHVMNRGNRRLSIFADSSDYLKFMDFVLRIKDKYPFKIHALCLMTNHYHMVIETGDIELGVIMQRLSSAYAENYNHRHNCTGHLFQGRYTACLINDDRYFLEVNRYIHLNPVKANMVQEPQEYLYSSYRLFANNVGCNYLPCTEFEQLMKQVVETDRVLKSFDYDSQKYQSFVADKVSHTEQESIIQKDIRENEFWLPMGSDPIKGGSNAQ